MMHVLLIQSLVLLLAASSLSACDSAPTRPAIAASEDHGQVLGHQVVKIFPQKESKALGASDSLLLPQAMFESDDGVFWIASLTALHTYDESTKKWKVFGRDSEAPLGVDTICQSVDHKIWLRSVLYESLRTYDGHSWRTKEQLGPNGIDGLPQLMFQGKAGRIWVVLKEGISSYNDGAWSDWFRPSIEAEGVYEQLRKTRLNSVSKVEDIRQRWTTTAPSRNDQAIREQRKGLINDVSVALEARSGFVWLGSEFALVEFNPSSGDWKVHALPLHSGRPRRVFEDRDGGLWLVDDSSQIMFFDPHHLRWAVYDLKNMVGSDSSDNLSSLLINGICQDKQGHIFLASNNGIINLDPAKRNWELLSGNNINMSDFNIMSTMQDKRGRIWLGTTEGILILQE